MDRLRGSVDWEAAAMGLEMVIGVLAALYIALLLKLEFPGWAVFTVLMLLLAQYVGAVQQKALFRLAGTVVGGALGDLATGALQQSPLLYLSVTFVVVARTACIFPHRDDLCGGSLNQPNPWQSLFAKPEPRSARGGGCSNRAKSFPMNGKRRSWRSMHKSRRRCSDCGSMSRPNALFQRLLPFSQAISSP
jgi:hypothetical protein